MTHGQKQTQTKWLILRLGLSLLALLLLSACTAQTLGSSQSQAMLTALNVLDDSVVCTASHIPTTSTTFFVLLGVGLLTGLSHCIGMCGPLVGAFTLHRRQAKQDLSMPLVLFQSGRLTTYFSLGLLLGSVGGLVIGLIRTWQGNFSIVLGLFMAAVGLSLLGILPLQKWLMAGAFAYQIGSWIKTLLRSDQPAASFGLGVANGLLPCGPVYAMALLAAASGNPFRGATIMLIFGLGTLPTMLGLGFTTSLLSLRLRSSLYRVAALLVIAVGVQLSLRGLALNGHLPHATLGGIMLW